ncbi:3-hydroxybutyryl-CoA dehydrogenase [Madurella fahalii]|uniref:3-hydroxybutyryl-CoA dehydrogenase n=1 Tax=Madurella fahalii TaxID=1157608 RepID=A0ABQ0GNA3_9PEZI
MRGEGHPGPLSSGSFAALGLDNDLFWSYVYEMDSRQATERARSSLPAKPAAASSGRRQGKRRTDNESEGESAKKRRRATAKDSRDEQDGAEQTWSEMRKAEAEFGELGNTICHDYSPKQLSMESARRTSKDKPKVEPPDEGLVADLVSRPYRYKVVDEDIIDRFEQLRYKIRELCGVGGRRSHPTAPEKILKLCWERLRDLIFSASSPYWAGSFGASMFQWFERMADDTARDSPRLLEINEYRARMTTLLYYLRGSPSPEQDAYTVAKIFGPAITARDSRIPKAWRYRFLSDALDILHLAADLDMMFRRSLSNFRISPSTSELEARDDELTPIEYGLCSAAALRQRQAAPAPLVSYRQLPAIQHRSFATGPDEKKAPPPRWHPPKEQSLDERPVLVVGAGNIGRRVALVWASNARPVTIYDISPDALHSATEYITDHLGAYCAERGTHPGHVCTTTDLRTATTTSGRHPEKTADGRFSPQEMTRAPWLAIECLPESLPLKTSVLALLERSLPSDCILASNSSSLTTAEMAAEGPLAHPSRLLNTHYFIPPRNRMVELMSSGETAPPIFSFLAAQMRRVGFAPVVVPRDVQSRGFVFNRIWAACKRETLAVLAEGVAKPADVDALFRDFFHAEKGPCERMDEVGLDTVARVEHHNLERNPGLGSEAALAWLRKNYVEKGNLGEKTGDGLFTEQERDALRERHHLERYKDVEETTGA